MIRHLLIAILIAACGDDLEPYTWGEASVEVATIYCDGGAACSFLVADECIAHTTWHLCAVNGTCDAEVDAEAAVEALDTCAAAVEQGAIDFETGADSRVCVGILFGALPAECSAVWALAPEAP